MKHLLIVNPVAGGSDHSDFVSRAAIDAFADADDAYEIYTTKGPMDAAARVRAEAEAGGELRVYACGGDGTLNECVNGAVGFPGVAVTHFPCGTGNDFIRMFGPQKALFSDLRLLRGGETRSFDVIDLDGRYCLNICSVGVDARIGADVHRYSHLPLIGGAGGYVISTALNFFRGINRPLRVTVGDQVFDGSMALFCACNGQHYGGGFHPVPEARPDDGRLDFLLVPEVSRLTFLRVIMPYAKGRFRDYPRLIRYLRGDSALLESGEEFVVNVDGEILRSRRLSLRLLPGGLRFFCPLGLDFLALKTDNGRNSLL
jgi:YegS/Rv2252/BmrU family lipid kinase